MDSPIRVKHSSGKRYLIQVVLPEVFVAKGAAGSGCQMSFKFDSLHQSAGISVHDGSESVFGMGVRYAREYAVRAKKPARHALVKCVTLNPLPFEETAVLPDPTPASCWHYVISKKSFSGSVGKFSVGNV